MAKKVGDRKREAFAQQKMAAAMAMQESCAFIGYVWDDCVGRVMVCMLFLKTTGRSLQHDSF